MIGHCLGGYQKIQDSEDVKGSSTTSRTLRNISTKDQIDKVVSLFDRDMFTWNTLCLPYMQDCFSECCFAFRVQMSNLLIRKEVQGVHKAGKV